MAAEGGGPQGAEIFGLLVNAMKDYAIFMLAPDGRVASWNQGAERIKGYRAEEIIGQHFSCFYTDEDNERGKPKQELAIAAAEGRHEDQGWRVRKDGSRFWANVIIIALRDVAGRLRGFAKITRDLTEHRRAEEKLYLEEELQTAYNFDEIIGENPGLKRVLKQAETVAPTDATVLILGETGTGKELVARAIHNMSTRRERTFVKLNCAAIPTGLLESELFGHEKGAFTGAIAQKVGRAELAHLGTLFLDEIGDIPLELQPKLLRLLQEKEFERLGGTRTVSIDVRLIAATNRDLGQMVAEQRFRSDLYYRLNVFPVTLPPLRERPEDIPTLACYFVQKYAPRMNKRIQTIPVETMEALTRWRWPGNIRELENFIERAVILSPGPILQVPLSELKAPREEVNTTLETSLEAVEREHIIRVLREAGGVIGGPQGAAARLGVKRTTLNGMMRRLGISRKDLLPREEVRTKRAAGPS
jgi:PAS domain S-box-containing protein